MLDLLVSLMNAFIVTQKWESNTKWCASNLLAALANKEDSDRCLCSITEAKYIGEETKEDEERFGTCRVDELES